MGIRARRWTSALIVGELALTLVLLAGAGFMMRSFLMAYQADIGIDTTPIVTANVSIPDRKYHEPEQRVAFYRQLDERLDTIGALEAATVASSWPGGAVPTARLSSKAVCRTRALNCRRRRRCRSDRGTSPEARRAAAERAHEHTLEKLADANRTGQTDGDADRELHHDSPPIAAVLVSVTLVASLWPARRATRLDPVAALRNE